MMGAKRKSTGRLFAIGDLHGCPDELATLLKAIKPGRGDTVVFIGDYIDRGPSPRAVVDQLLDLQPSGCECVYLKGNHEDMMLSFLGLPGRYGDSFLFNGGANTMDSYGVAETELEHAIDFVPAKHLEFLKGLATSYLRPPYFFVHAGVMPMRPLEEQEVEDLLWIRQEFIFNPHQLGHAVIFGHTPVREVLVDLPFKIGIDTGLVYGGKLSCIELEESVLYQVARGAKEVKSRRLQLS